MRLIDADKIKYKHRLNTVNTTMPQSFPCITKDEIDKQPTVEAIPTARLKKLHRDMADKLSDSFIEFVREEFIPKDEYEQHLKADKLAMLEELDNKIMEEYIEHMEADWHDIIQQKINELKGVEE